MKLIDVHCHLDKNFFPDLDFVINEAKRENVVLIIPAGVDKKTNRDLLVLQNKYPEIIFPALGFYPPDALFREKLESDEIKTSSSQQMIFDKSAFETELIFIEKNANKIIAIGEIGLDFKNGTDFKLQEKIFKKQIELSMKIDKPVIVHSRNAEERVIEILESYDCKKVIMHCFCGKKKLIRRVRENDWYFSIPTSVVRDQHFQNIVLETPLYRIFTETDSPYLSPYKDDRKYPNMPHNVSQSIHTIAKLRNMEVEDVANIIYRNTQWMFGKKYKQNIDSMF